MAVSEVAVAVLAAKFAVMREVADERTWRVTRGSEALALGRGGIKAVALAAGVSETTVAAGVSEIGSGELDGLPPGRSRRPGAGRRKAEDTQPGLRQALKELAGGGHARRSGGGGHLVLAVAAGAGAADGAAGVPVREGRAGADAGRGRLQPAGDGEGAGGQAAPGPG